MALAILTLFGAFEGAADETRKSDEVVVPPRKGDTKNDTLFDGKTLGGWKGR